MTSKPAFKIVFATIITGLFGYLMYILVNSVITGFFFTDSDGMDVVIMSTAMIAGPIVLSIICSIIRKRHLWWLALANMFLCCMIAAAFGEEPTMAHAYAYGGMIVVPYILCLIMIFGEKKKEKEKTYSSGSSSYSGYSSSGGSGYSSGGSMSFSEKEAYILRNCHSAYSTTGMEKIENDPNLTASQKEELKHHLFVYGD